MKFDLKQIKYGLKWTGVSLKLHLYMFTFWLKILNCFKSVSDVFGRFSF